MVADPFAPRLRGNRRSTACAASCRLARITPASHMARLFSGEIERNMFIRRNERIRALTSDRKNVVKGKRVSVRVEPGGRRLIKKNKKITNHIINTRQVHSHRKQRIATQKT